MVVLVKLLVLLGVLGVFLEFVEYWKSWFFVEVVIRRNGQRYIDERMDTGVFVKRLLEFEKLSFHGRRVL